MIYGNPRLIGDIVRTFSLVVGVLQYVQYQHVITTRRNREAMGCIAGHLYHISKTVDAVRVVFLEIRQRINEVQGIGTVRIV